MQVPTEIALPKELATVQQGDTGMSASATEGEILRTTGIVNIIKSDLIVSSI